jgi:PTH1 family peptidyl-tRNA hydrolase
MKLIVGLGNPGRKYQGTRHNVGFDVVQELAKRHALGGFRTKFKGEYCEARVGGQAAILLIPHTYMNLSGQSVQPATVFFKIETDDVLVVCDDFNLPLARLRFRAGGSAGGQKGLADILRCLGTQDVPRLRIGIGNAPPQWDVADYVLSKFRPEELEPVAEAVGRAVAGLNDWARHGVQYCMNRYNADLEKKAANKDADKTDGAKSGEQNNADLQKKNE